MSTRLAAILILCTGNSARSILAEAILNKKGAGRLVAYSAGSFPKGQVHPQALALLARLGYSTEGLRSKSWDEFAGSTAPSLDYIITVCDNAAGEVCPIWPGAPITAHWGVPDPAGATGSDTEVAAAFAETYKRLERRIDAFLAAPFEGSDRAALKSKLDEIGEIEDGDGQ
ncbi:arsenate reductase ArsC [Phenylobacterium immobile]|uniref:arsenate reductase ArsC n=1 Tax=Phenylobacterium immobile TaxID=21 RepID=UPI000AA40614|nr:arsenate reductase ArsC [Phenylobacterium immobile]